MYVSNRGEGSVSVVDFATRTVIDEWQIPGGGSPDMGGLNADGSVLWLSGRYHHEVYAFDTKTGKLLTQIRLAEAPTASRSTHSRDAIRSGTTAFSAKRLRRAPPPPLPSITVTFATRPSFRGTPGRHAVR